MHVASVIVLDLAEAPADFGFGRVRDTVLERLPLLPQLRWRPVQFPLGLDRPLWAEDVDIDLAYHFRAMTLPAPGGNEELDAVAGELLEQPLELDRPLWQLWFIDGLADGKVALFQKTHHALIDGATGMSLLDLLFDTTPRPDVVPAGAGTSLRDERVPSDPELLARGLMSVVARTPLRIAAAMPTLGRWAVTAAGIRLHGQPVFPVGAPRCSLNGPLTSRRKVAFASVPLDRVKVVKDAYGVKVNDVVLAVCASALRRYLLSIADLPDEPLVANVPISLRAEGNSDYFGNKIGMIFVPLATDVDDPVTRLRTIYESSQEAKAVRRALDLDILTELGSLTPPGLLGLISRSQVLRRRNETSPSVNTGISNVPGPPVPLFIAGARIAAMLPTGPILMGMGLNFGVLTYAGTVQFGITACPERVPEPARVAAGIPPALAELEVALV